jgi:CRISPR-associated endonuclease Csn1
MNELRALFHRAGLLPLAARDALALPTKDPWRLRAEGLDRRLSGEEFAAALGHIARHRGFKSNAKRPRSENAIGEEQKMLKAIEGTVEKLSRYRTVGAMFALDPEFADRKRNRGGGFDRSILRDDQEREMGALFAAQRRLGNAAATEELEAEYRRIALFQRPLQDSEHLLGKCQFEPTETRTARRGYAFEMFRLLSRLANLRLTERGNEWALTPEQMAEISADFGRRKGITYKAVRAALDLDPRVRFKGVPEKDEKYDIVARSGDAATGTYTLRQIVCDGGWRTLMATPVQRDRIAEIVTFRDDPASIRRGLDEAGVDPFLADAIMRGLADGKLGDFKGAGHISAKAARALLPPLSRGLGYADACAEVGYDHAAQAQVNVEDVRNPVARKALSEMLKQVRAIVAAHGAPDAIHVELARDIGKSAEERDEIKRGIEKRNKERDKLRDEFKDLLRREPTIDDMLRYELWKEQGGRCLYTDDPIDPNWIVSGDNRAQVDHILPWSRFGDDSFMNKTLCTAAANQAKRNRSPFE